MQPAAFPTDKLQPAPPQGAEESRSPAASSRYSLTSHEEEVRRKPLGTYEITPETARPELSQKPKWVSDTIADIEKVLASDAPKEQLLTVYQQVSQELLNREGVIAQRSDHGEFLKVNIDCQLLCSVRKLIARFVEKRHDEFLSLQDVEQRIQWLHCLVTQGDMRIFSDAEQHCKIPGMAQAEAWNYIIRNLILKNFNAEAAKNIALRSVQFLIPYGSGGYMTELNFSRRIAMNQFMGYNPDKSKIKLSKQQLDELELYALLTHRHPLSETPDAPGSILIPETGLQVDLPTSGPVQGDETTQPVKQHESLRLDRQNRVPEAFASTLFNLSLKPSKDYKAIVTVLLPEQQKLWVIPCLEGDSVTPLEKIKQHLGSSARETANILYFSLAEEKISNLEELMTFFPKASQFNIVTPFRELSNHKECAPEKNLWTFSNFSLMKQYISDFPRGYFSLSYNASLQTFTLTINEDPTGKKPGRSQSLESPFTWSTETFSRPDRGLLWYMTSFGLNFYRDFTCSITQKSIDEITDPCFDKQGRVYERADLLKWLRSSPTNPSDRTPMTVNNILELPLLKQKLMELKSIGQRYPLASISMPSRTSLKDESASP